jgi:polyribonucleotide nucleotidyltransferase
MPKQTEVEDDDEALVDVTIEGDAYGVEQAKSEIERIIRDRQNMPRQKMTPGQKADKPRGPAEDEITLNLKISPQYHRELIGARGSQVNRLQDRYGVRVNFPRSVSASASDAGSEYGGLRSPRPQQASDEVIIRGPRKGAEEARDELLGLLQYIAETSFTDTVSVQAAQISSLIGQGGREIAALRLDTGAHIDVPQVDKENSNGTERVQIKLKGTKKQVEAAKKAIQERSQIFDKTIVKTLKVDKKHHKALIGGQGRYIYDGHANIQVPKSATLLLQLAVLMTDESWLVQ